MKYGSIKSQTINSLKRLTVDAVQCPSAKLLEKQQKCPEIRQYCMPKLSRHVRSLKSIATLLNSISLPRS